MLVLSLLGVGRLLIQVALRVAPARGWHFLKTRAVNSDAEQEINNYEVQPAFDDVGGEENTVKDDNLCKENIEEREEQKTTTESTTEEYLNNNRQQQLSSSNTPPSNKFKKQNLSCLSSSQE